jgi:hypothetical protein
MGKSSIRWVGRGTILNRVVPIPGWAMTCPWTAGSGARQTGGAMGAIFGGPLAVC